MDKKEPVKIKTETKEVWRNTKTNEIFEQETKGPDIVKDVTVTVTNEGLDLLQKVMQNANKPKA